MTLRRIRRALLSVSDKTGLVELARGLADFGVELISTGGTYKALATTGLPVREVNEVTSFPEMLDGRVKTLHPRIHAGILAVRDNAQHDATLEEHGIGPIDLVVVNLYPFESTIAKPDVVWDNAIENIDIGGPSMIRAAAKNHDGVAVLTDPGQYAEFLAELREQVGGISLASRQKLAAAAFARTAAYDVAIAGYWAKCGHAQAFPARLALGFEKRIALRYGENPHQRAAFYAEPAPPVASVAAAEQLHGKELSYNNILDLDSAWNLVAEFREPACVIVKHNNPCGAAEAGSPVEAFRLAYEGDALSAYGGILAFNRTLDAATAQLVTEPNRFVEAIIAPDFSPEAFEIITTRPSWKKNVRLLRTGGLPDAEAAQWDYRRVGGGLLVQSADRGGDDPAKWVIATKRVPTSDEHDALSFAWRVCKHVKSNAIVLALGRQIVGVGAGQMSRVDSTEIAVKKAGDRVRGSVLASDAFFPFRDNIDVAAKAGVVAIIQPGGSVRDAECVAACDENGITMLLTGTRHFRH